MSKALDILLIVALLALILFLLWFAYHLGQHNSYTIDDLFSQIPVPELLS